ncbi:MAG TPA: hypothetical protein VH120_13845 [Gemmataceae bacterium]|nr:hypothetical protein [Gemmataceae bacterium]
MTVEQFADITYRIIGKQGFDGFLPTACYPEKSEVCVLEGMPNDVEPESTVLDWATRSAGSDEEFLVAFKSGPAEFRVIRRQGASKESAQFNLGEPNDVSEH